MSQQTSCAGSATLPPLASRVSGLPWVGRGPRPLQQEDQGLESSGHSGEPEKRTSSCPVTQDLRQTQLTVFRQAHLSKGPRAEAAPTLALPTDLRGL